MNGKRGYQTPFHVDGGIIRDAEGRTVKLWGVNYYVPFNHNYFNIRELGLNHREIIDEDLRHFELLGIDLIRMHLYEREITDRTGNIIENENMELLDYLIEACEKKGIYLMLSPTVWWNTVANQIRQEELYAYWHIGAQEAFGFTNFFSCDAMLWDQDAIDCQARYLRGLFNRRNRISGKRMNEYSNIVVFELFNEPRYPEKWQLEKDLELTPEWMSAATYSRGEERKKLVRLWEEFRAGHPGHSDDACFSLFRAHILNHYFDSLWLIITDFFGDRVIRAQFISYSGLPDEDLREVFEKAPIEAATIGTYLNASGLFDAVNTDSANHLQLASRWFDRFKKAPQTRLARISYEFDATGSTTAYPLAAIAAMYAQTGIQMASYFTYTPSGIAPWNPGWLVHFLNLEHTPSRAAGFAAAGEIFRSNETGCPVECGPEEWNGKNFKIRRENDLVVFASEETFIYTNDTDEVPPAPERLRKIIGRGKSCAASSSGNGCYILLRQSETEWELEVFPDQKFLMDPTRGRTYRSMANRYVNCRKEPPVSQTMRNEVEFSFALRDLKACRSLSGEEMRVERNRVRLRPGRYLLTIDGETENGRKFREERKIMKTAGKLHFSLVELLIAVAVIAILIALLMPALHKAREKAFNIQCVNNMKNIGTAHQLYANDTEHCMPLMVRKDFTWVHEVAARLSKGKDKNGEYMIPCPAWTLYPSNSYGLNTFFSGEWDTENVCKKITRIHQPTKAQILLENITDPRYNWPSNVGYLEWVSFRHNRRSNVYYFDGHVGTILCEQEKQTNLYFGNLRQGL